MGILGEDKNRLLVILTSLFGVLSFVSLFISITTDEWLQTEERLPDVNNTVQHVFINSGLWKKCSRKGL